MRKSLLASLGLTIGLTMSAPAHQFTYRECTSFAKGIYAAAGARDAGRPLGEQKRHVEVFVPNCRLDNPLMCPYKDAEDTARIIAVLDLMYAFPVIAMPPALLAVHVLDRCKDVAPVYGRGDEFPA